jgi:Putative prokaryotic signal transducing protein
MDAVTLTYVGDEMEAEMLCGLLRANGMECSYRRSDVSAGAGTYGGGFAIAGPTEVLVHEHDLVAARKLLPPQSPK